MLPTRRAWHRTGSSDDEVTHAFVGNDRGAGHPVLPSSEEREEIKALRKENYELRRANEILKAVSVFFATELDQDRTK